MQRFHSMLSTNPSFAVMVEFVGQFDIGMKPSSYHEVRVSLLHKEVANLKQMMKSYEEDRQSMVALLWLMDGLVRNREL